MSIDNALLVATPDTIDKAVEVVTDPSVPIQQRGAIYAGLRRLRLRIDRVLRPVTQDITLAMVQANAKDWGPLHLSWRAVDVKWPVNAPGNWEDETAQGALAELREIPAYRPFLRSIPRHLEVDTFALGEAVHAGDPGAQELWHLLSDHHYRTEAGKTATLTVKEGTE